MIKKWISYIALLSCSTVYADIAVLPPELAFPMKLSCADNWCEINITPRKSYYVYKDVTLQENHKDVNFSILGMIYVPKKRESSDESHVTMYSPMKIVFKKSDIHTITLSYRGCNAESFCYARMNRVFNIE